MSTARNHFKEKPLKYCINHINSLPLSDEEIGASMQDIKTMMSALIEEKRLLDISSLYTFLKHAYTGQKSIGVFFKPAEEVLKAHINELFTKSITYNNTDLKWMFSDILETDIGLLMELVSFIFKKYNLFEMKLSENINKQLVKIAGDDIYSFTEHADTHFLAFYLSALPKLSIISKDHIRKWTEMILYQITDEKYTSKILDAMKIHPSFEILMIFMLSPRENDRFRALTIMKKNLSSRRNPAWTELFAEKAPYFIRKALSSRFYYFHTIPRAQKELFAELLTYTDGRIIKEAVIPMIKEENQRKDHQITDTKLTFIPAVRSFIGTYPDIVPQFIQILRDEGVETEVKELIRKAIQESK